MSIKIGDKFVADIPSAELMHVIEYGDGKVLARVNGSEYCMEGSASKFDSFPKTQLSDEDYRKRLDDFWATGVPTGKRVELKERAEMGIDVRAVAGFTVKFEPSEELLEVYNCNDYGDLLDELDIERGTIGNSMSGVTQEVILLVPTAQGVDQQIADWLDELNEKLNTKLTTEDVTFIAEVYSY